MKTILIEFKDHDKVVLTDEVGNTYTSYDEELIDFLSIQEDKILISNK